MAWIGEGKSLHGQRCATRSPEILIWSRGGSRMTESRCNELLSTAWFISENEKKKKGGSGQTQNYGIGSEEKMELDDHFDDFGHICRSYSNSFTCSHMNVNSFRTAPCATGSSSQAPSHLLLSSPRLISLWPCSRPSWFQYVLYRSISSMMRPLRRFSIVSRIETDDLSSQQQGLLCTERI